MQCDICCRPGNDRLSFLCPVDARNRLYGLRLDHARVLLETGELDQRISAASVGLLTAQTNVSNSNSVSPNWGQYGSSIVSATKGRIEQICAQADMLRAKLKAAREEIVKKKVHNLRRKSELASGQNGLSARRLRLLDEAEKKIKMTTYKWNRIQITLAQSRAFLCGEVARLYGLSKIKSFDDEPSNDYSIAGVTILDLRKLNSASPAQITTSLSSMAHLLVLATHYLGIRLPAEITLARRDYPLPTVLHINASYLHENIPFPGSSGTSFNNSPSASKHGDYKDLPRPRPLFVSKPLPLLAKEDPSAYALFIEGVSLFAYDLAWVCRSQYIPSGVSGASPPIFADFCTVGHNLHALLIGSSHRPSPPSRAPSTQSTPTKSSKATPEVSNESHLPNASNPGVGHYSHGTAHTFLGSAAGNEFIRSFKLLNPTKIADKLKSHLLAELSSAEWEVVDRDVEVEHGDIRGDDEDDGVMVGARRTEDYAGLVSRQKSTTALLGTMKGMNDPGAQSFMSMRTVVEAVEAIDVHGERTPGTSGWTRVKTR